MQITTNRIIHRFIRGIEEYESGGEYFSQIIPIDTQAYAYYSTGEKLGLFYVFGDGEHTYTEIRDGASTLETAREYPAYPGDGVLRIYNRTADPEHHNPIVEFSANSQVDVTADIEVASDASGISYTNPRYPEVTNVKEALDILNEKRIQDIDLTKVDEYLYSIRFYPEQMDYRRAVDYLYEYFHQYSTRAGVRRHVNPRSNNDSILGACSSIRKGNFYGRNYDWYYSESVSFVVKKEAGDGRYASIGMTGGGFPKINKADVESGVYQEVYDLLPFVLVDGINEHGVVVNINVVPVGERGIAPTTGTHPELAGDNISVLQLPSYILDYFKSASEAVDWIRDSAKIYGLYNENVQEELHIMIADEEDTYIVEFVNNEAVIHEGKTFMTNFYLTGVEFDTNGKPIRSTVTPHGQGLERYEIIAENYNKIRSESSMRNLMNMLTYTNAYKTDPLNKWWMTEFVADYAAQGFPYPDLTVMNTPQDFVDCGLLDKIKELFELRTRDGVSTWQTVHSSVYDIKKRQFTLLVQEQGVEKTKTFQLFPVINDGKLQLYINDPEFIGEPACEFSANSNVDVKFNIKHNTFIFEQESESDCWEINHNLNKYPSVTIVDSANTVVEGGIEYTGVNSCVIRFNAPFKGKAYLN